ncbi:2-phospho-L-lactate transferase [Mycobacteroides abscessus subsp. abscessus]|uniref:2-phospho-L-lactate transferase n=5 Tax=Mycobacteroides abscessus TaxID=36809 RepID=A0A1N5LV34_9MYCO|nr:2-phospho-L-lactate transferase [Mycobacteroides abscessus V06705]MBE5402944.1 2-phospho-L-lactate transferase [Mycobacteroides abscessus]SHO82592.1 2-phospho-L-lactate transferase [Mycobacteroides abscessus subsp. abscessus]MBE5412114.1 2-phospho-L-lactate transferase [Mycobacteroides abscessus]MBE5417089.1 2-phospho-L-lactate transferase [Mycobacteroides abscessus]
MITHVFAAGVKRRTKIHTIYDRQNRRGALVACRVIAGALVSVNVKVTVLVGGVGGARFLLGVQRLLGSDPSKHQINAVVNIGDDAWMHGVRICPDLDTCMYTLGGAVDPERGWGHRGETWNAMEELAAYGAQPDWFSLGDRDLATHLIRSQMLRAGYPLSAVTEALCNRWQPGVRLLPASDDRCETHVVITDPTDGEQRAIHFQQWWVQHRAQVPTHSFAFIGADEAKSGPGVAEAIGEADVVLLAPSNPVVSIGAILAVGGVRGALRTTSAPVIGYSPIVSGKPLRGMADECLRVIGVEVSSQGVGEHFGARSQTGILDGWLVDEGDAAHIAGVQVRSVPLLMTDPDATAAMVRAGLDLAGVTL